MSNISTNPVVYIGTYTEHVGSTSKGICIYRLNLASGELTFEGQVAAVRNPSYLEIHPQGQFLYAVNEVQSFGGEEGGGVSAFSINPESGEVALLNAQSSHGKDPCYISVERTGRFALVANYSGGSAALLPIAQDGKLGPATDVVQHSGSSLHPERQTEAHAHCILPDPTNRFAIVVDLGLDKLLVYRLDLDRGKLHKHSEVSVQPGAGPRHLTFHPNRQYAYLVNELNATLSGYRYDAESGSFQELQTVPALPEDFTGENLCAEVRVSPDGRYLYTSNRGHDSLVCYSIDRSTGLLSYRHHTPTGGREPRNFAIDPAGAFLLAANQKSGSIVTFRIDSESGELTRTGHEVQVSMPVCVKFARLP